MRRIHQPSAAHVGVFGLDGSMIVEASIVLERLTDQDRMLLQFSDAWGGYVGTEVPPGTYVLTVSSDGFETQRREVHVTVEGLDETVVLGRPGLPHYYRGASRIPFEPVPYIAISFAGPPSEADANSDRIMRRFRLESIPVGKPVRDELVGVFRVPGDPGPEKQGELIVQLAAQEGVRHVGPVIALRDDAVAFLTKGVIAKFQPSVSRADVEAVAARLDLTVRRQIPYAGNAFLLETRDAWKSLDICDALVESGTVVYAEPNLVATARDTQVIVGDFLFSQQWHIPLVNLPTAWASMRALNVPGVVPGAGGDLTFGSEIISIAVFDRGIQSTTLAGGAQAVHPDFSGSVTGGASKVSCYFDFVNMSPDNNNPINNHGMNCAGVAAALANNPSPVQGEYEGVVGAAPNCRVMGIIRPSGDDELQYADAYYWVAGFDPGSVRATFPRPLLPGAGADVISNSFDFPGGIGNHAPISGLMRDCFDFLTTYGRGGKGVVLCFSAGNNTKDFRMESPWAASSKTIAVAASTQMDKVTSYSNFGFGIDLCAPGGDGTIVLVTSDLIGAGKLPGHSGGSLDYTNKFIGTSASTPLVAGIAALVLSAAPALKWWEVRDILCDTAIQIDIANTDPIGRWLDLDGDGVLDYSQWYGFGRVDAGAAVSKAVTTQVPVWLASVPAQSIVRGPHLPLPPGPMGILDEE